jgi:hypothetical protein
MKILLLIVFIAVIAASCITSNTASIETTENEIMLNQEKNESSKKIKGTPVIVELFTSEGCSSCPPADKVLATLERTQPIEGAEIIVLSEHVDYWNRLGWTDPFSSAQFSSRQDEYRQHFKRGDVYTPQMVVDGTHEFVGSNANEAGKTITEAAKEPKGEVEIKIEKIEGNKVFLSIKVKNLPKISSGDTAVVMLAVTENNLATSVLRGENAGSKLPHTAVVRYLQNISSADFDNKTLMQVIELQRDWQRNNLSLVAFVQEIGSRRIFGATKINLMN